VSVHNNNNNCHADIVLLAISVGRLRPVDRSHHSLLCRST